MKLEWNHLANNQGSVVESTISANPELNFNLLFWFMHLCNTIRYKTLKNKRSI